MTIFTNSGITCRGEGLGSHQKVAPKLVNSVYQWSDRPTHTHPHTRARAPARTHARTHALTHTHTHPHTHTHYSKRQELEPAFYLHVWEGGEECFVSTAHYDHALRQEARSDFSTVMRVAESTVTHVHPNSLHNDPPI